MNTKNNQLKQDNDKRIRDALFSALEEGRIPAVSEICEKAQINRSTFYRRYMDVYDLMDKTEADIQKGLAETFAADKDWQKDSLEQLIAYVGDYRSFYSIYLRDHIGSSMEKGLSVIWDKQIRPLFINAGVTDEAHMNYYFQFIRAGVMMVLKEWIEGGCAESPAEIASVIRTMLISSYHK